MEGPITFRRKWIFSFVAFVLAAWLPGTLVAETISVPFGTRVFIELDQRVTSKKKHNRPGSFVTAHVWRDVVVNGQTDEVMLDLEL